MIKNAKDYVYFTTPYLIVSDELGRELRLAAKRGVDVRLITPGIPDKKAVFQVTRSYYAGLVRDGVRIYEYTPGFIHAKQCVCDGETAVVGTINLDYRSLYLHFENGVFLYDCEAIKDIKADFDGLFPICQEVTEEYRSGRSAVLRIGQCYCGWRLRCYENRNSPAVLVRKSESSRVVFFKTPARIIAIRKKGNKNEWLH